MKPFAVMDMETDPFKHGRFPKPFLTCLYSEIGFFVFRRVADFIDHIKDMDIIIYAHNGGKFDFMFMLEYLNAYEEIRIINGRLSQFKIGKAVFRDSWLVFPMALSAYKKDEIDYGIFEANRREKPANMTKIIEYCRADCRYTYELIEGFRAKFGNKLTLAGAAMTYHSKMTGIDPPKTTRAFFEAYRPFYWGGRVECFKKGIYKGKTQIFDINSAYPRAMLDLHAFGNDVLITDKLDRKALPLSFVEIDAESIGFFPFGEKTGTEFPNDGETRRFHVTGHELKAALELRPRLKFKLIRQHIFSQGIEFSQYINHWYEIRKASAKGSVENIVAKLAMNSLYGKYGSNPQKYKKYMLVPQDEIDMTEKDVDENGNAFTLGNTIGPWALMEKPLDEIEMRFYNIATAASVTGWVRAFLLKSLARAKGALYCDTDSIHCESFDGDLSDELGAWKLEFTGNKAAYCGKKLYAVTGKEGEKIASKGARLTAAEIFEIAGGKTIEYKQAAPTLGIRKGGTFMKRNISMT